MKPISFSVLISVPVLRLAICALLIASANQSANASDKNSSNPSGAIFATNAADGGRLFIQRSPVLGRNVSIVLTIDGKPAGTLLWGRTYDRYITPGRHILTASPNRSRGAWQGTLNVHPGETHSYSASYNVSKLVLTPVSGSR
jgi:hypothetical protein